MPTLTPAPSASGLPPSAVRSRPPTEPWRISPSLGDLRPAAPTRTVTRRRARHSPKARAALKLQGRYVGHMRQLKARAEEDGPCREGEERDGGRDRERL